VDGQLTFNTSAHIAEAALAGLGIAFLPEQEVAEGLEQGTLIRVLERWCEPFPGYYLYYPSRKQHSPAFTLVREALRLKEGA
jgi:DNA-binding transcriptional LysR family regulator